VPAIAKLVQINFHTDNIWTDTTSTIIGCDILCDDDHHSCFNIGQMSKWQRGQVKGTTVWFEVKECQLIAGHYQWVNIPYEIRPGSGAKDSIFVYTTSSQTTKWYFVGFIYRRDVVAPECNNAQNDYCDNFYSNIPTVIDSIFAGNYSDEGQCDNQNALAFFQPVYEDQQKKWNFPQFNLDPCFNRETQTWEFSTNIPNIELNSMIDLCYDNISNHNFQVLNDTNDVKNIFSGDCDLALRSFEGHRKYPYEIEEGGYVIKEVLLEHENNHRKVYESIMDEFKPFYENEKEFYYPACIDFLNLEDAHQKFQLKFNSAFSNFYNNYFREYLKRNGLDKNEGGWEKRNEESEEDANGTESIKYLIDNYIRILNNHCENP